MTTGLFQTGSKPTSRPLVSRKNHTPGVRIHRIKKQVVTLPSTRFSNRKFNREPQWRGYLRVPASAVPPLLRSWLLDQGSLTQRLVEASRNQFRVEIINQRIERPRLSELRALAMPPRQRALVREVLLYGGDEAWVYARSILPLPTLTGRLRRLRKLDNRPLGALLFNDPTMRRGPVEIACISAQKTQLPREVRHFDKPLWGRRSVFYLSGKPLLVSEIFLPTFSPYNSHLSPAFPKTT